MRQLLFQIIILFVQLSVLSSCGTSGRAVVEKSMVTADDFAKGMLSQIQGHQTVIISQEVDKRINYLYRMPWKSYGEKNLNRQYYVYCWETSIEEKIYLSANDREELSKLDIDYFYPRDARWDLMTECKIRLSPFCVIYGMIILCVPQKQLHHHTRLKNLS